MPIIRVTFKKDIVLEGVLDVVEANLQQIIVDALKTSDVTLEPKDVTLEFYEAHERNVCSRDLQILTLANDYPERLENADKRAAQIRLRVKELIGNEGITVATPIFLGKFGVSGG